MDTPLPSRQHPTFYYLYFILHYFAFNKSLDFIAEEKFHFLKEKTAVVFKIMILKKSGWDKSCRELNFE